jgi:hypothetical protein
MGRKGEIYIVVASCSLAVTNYQCPMPNAQCPMPNAQSPIPYSPIGKSKRLTTLPSGN